MKPRRLNEGARVGIVAPSSPMSPDKRELALERFESFGYEPILGDSVSAEHGYLAGDDQMRAYDLNHMFARADIEAIFCLRGGYGSMRILSMLDYQMIAQNPKPFVGYSDITALHLAIQQKSKLNTFHGPMLGELSQSKLFSSWHWLLQLLTGQITSPLYQSDDLFFQVTPGMACGELIGGNLTMIATTLGTPYEIDTRGKILFLEDVNEPPYSIDRLLTQLMLAGRLQQTNGIIVTSCKDCHPTPNKQGFRLEETIADVLSPLNIPCFIGLPIGHMAPNVTLPIGCMAKIDANRGTLEVLEHCVED